MLCGQLRKQFGPILQELALRKENKVVEGGLKVDHVQMLVSIPSKYSVSQVVGYVKGKSAIWVARAMGGHVGTHLDSVGHVSKDGGLFQGIEASNVQDYHAGLKTLGIDQIPPIVGRGILLDIAQCKGVNVLEGGTLSPPKISRLRPMPRK